MLREWPLHGRSKELRAGVAALSPRRASAGVAYVGDAGVGKSRLGREVATVAGQHGLRTEWITATTSSQVVPLGVFTPYLHGREPSAAQALQGISDVLADAGADPGLLVVDDVHLLDQASALVVGQVVRRERLSLVMTMRPADPVPDAIRALWKDGLVDRIRVRPLDVETTTELLRTVLGGSVTPGTAHRLWTWSRGNPLYLRELVRAGVRGHHLEAVGDQWEWSGPPALSADLVEAMELRLARLPANCLEVVDLLALGEPLGLRLLERLVDRMALETTELRELLTVGPPPEMLISLDHPLYAEVRRLRMGRLRARRLRGRLAVAMSEEPDQSPAVLLRRGMLSLDSDLEPDPDLFTSAARRAAAMVDLDAAARLAREAISAGGGAEPRLVLAHVTGVQGGLETTLHLLDEVVGGSQDTAMRAQARITQIATLIWPGRDLDAAEAVLAASTTDLLATGHAAHLAAMEATVHAVKGNWQGVFSAAHRAHATGAVPPLAHVEMAFGLMIAAGSLGRLSELQVVAEEAYAAALADPSGLLVSFGLSHLHLLGLQRLGELGRARRIAEARYDELSLLPGQTTAYGLGLVGHADLAQGRVRSAADSLQRVLERLPVNEPTGFRYLSLLNLSIARALVGDVEGATGTVSELLADLHPAFAFTMPEVELAQAWVAAAGGALTRAVGHCHRAVEASRERAMPAAEVLAWHTAAGFGDPAAAVPLTSLLGQVEGSRARITGRHALAVSVADGHGLLHAAQELEACGDLLFAANAAAQAALAFRDHGAVGDAVEASATAQRLRECCEGARTPALLAAAGPLPLTSRQLEIVTLAAHGLSNREIATQLTVSTRTVEGHLYRACTRLGVERRGQLRPILVRAGHLEARDE